MRLELPTAASLVKSPFLPPRLSLPWKLRLRISLDPKSPVHPEYTKKSQGPSRASLHIHLEKAELGGSVRVLGEVGPGLSLEGTSSGRVRHRERQPWQPGGRHLGEEETLIKKFKSST